MTGTVRDQIFEKLQNSPAGPEHREPDILRCRPQVPEDRDGLVEAFCAKFTGQTGILYEHDPAWDISETLARICTEHGISRIVSTSDKNLSEAGLPGAAENAGLEISAQADFKDRRAFTDAVFEYADAGLTGADFAIAESGTLVLVFDRDNARLVSLAPEIHIAVLFKDHIVALYEHAAERIFSGGKAPSQVAFITGPSMTADIRGQQFKGMHGPRKLIVLLI
ncbi:MAG: LutC/YkgG family protein [Desulfosalsimonas sp.]